MIHTSVPWHACKCGKCTQIYSNDPFKYILRTLHDEDDAEVASPSFEEAKANAIFIELSVNNHNKLVDSCKKSFELFQEIRKRLEETTDPFTGDGFKILKSNEYEFLKKVIAESEVPIPQILANGMLPLTKGLLVSMAMRSDHSYGLDKPEGLDDIEMMLNCGHTNESRIKLIIEMFDLYKRFVCGYQPTEKWWDDQVKEEVTGKGFYTPEKEISYATSWPKDFSPLWFLD